MNECAFCKIIRRGLPADIIFEDESVLVTLDIDDAVKGHILVIWKDHHLNASDLNEDEFIHFAKIFYNAEKVVLKLVHKKKALVLKTGILVSHFHFHIYPVDVETGWEEIKNIFGKEVKYSYKEGEKEKLRRDLQAALLIK